MLLLAYIKARAGFLFMYSQVMLQLIGCADIKVMETRCHRCSIKTRTDLLTLFVTSSVHSLPTRPGAKCSSQPLLIYPFFTIPPGIHARMLVASPCQGTHTTSLAPPCGSENQHGFGMPENPNASLISWLWGQSRLGTLLCPVEIHNYISMSHVIKIIWR